MFQYAPPLAGGLLGLRVVVANTLAIPMKRHVYSIGEGAWHSGKFGLNFLGGDRNQKLINAHDVMHMFFCTWLPSH